MLLFKMGLLAPTITLLKERMSPILVYAALGLLKNLLLGGGTPL